MITVGDQTLGSVVAGTGSWDSYRNQTIGSMTLPEGETDLFLRSDGRIRNSLLDVRQIVLQPQ